MPKVSIIVPIYNRSKTIGVCIKSILALNYVDFELIVVNDGSGDESDAICRKLIEEDSRIVYAYQENKGVSAARNHGLALAKGEWVTFVDSDDALLPFHLEIVEKEANNADLLMVGSTSARIINDEIIPYGDIVKNNRIESSNAADYFMSNEFNPYVNFFFSIWDKFFKLDIIKENKIVYNETMSLGEDLVFVCDYCRYANGLVYYTRSSYVNIQWPGIEHLGTKIRKPEDYLHNQKQCYEALVRLQRKRGSQFIEQFAINFAIDRAITRIIYNFATGRFGGQLTKVDLESFVDSQLKPFIYIIDTHKFNAVNFDVRFAHYLLLNYGLDITLFWAKLYCKFIGPMWKYVFGVMERIKRIIIK